MDDPPYPSVVDGGGKEVRITFSVSVLEGELHTNAGVPIPVTLIHDLMEEAVRRNGEGELVHTVEVIEDEDAQDRAFVAALQQIWAVVGSSEYELTGEWVPTGSDAPPWNKDIDGIVSLIKRQAAASAEHIWVGDPPEEGQPKESVKVTLWVGLMFK